MSDTDPNVRAFYPNESFNINPLRLPKDLPVDLEEILSAPTFQQNVLARRIHISKDEHSKLCSRINDLPAELRPHIFGHLGARRLPALKFWKHRTAEQTIHDAVRAILPKELRHCKDEVQDAVTKVVSFKMTVDRHGESLFNKRTIKSTHPGIVRLDISLDYPNQGGAIDKATRHVGSLHKIFPGLKVLHVALKQKYLLGGDEKGKQPDLGRYLEASCKGVVAALLKADVREKWVLSSHRETFKTCLTYMEKSDLEGELKRWDDGEGEDKKDFEGVLGMLVSRFDVWIPIDGLGDRKREAKTIDE